MSPDHRFLVTEKGKPFYWLGDTAWWLMRVPPADQDRYLEHRARHGFNVVQVHCGRLVADHAGRQPYANGDALQPNEAYWQGIDRIVEAAARRRLYVALVPQWGAEYGQLFGADAGRARRFGEWIGRRYAGRANVVWIASGEHDSINGFRLPIRPEQRAVLNAAAAGIRAATGGKQLMTIHPGAARTSSGDFHAEPWLDFDMLQSGHMVSAEAFGQAENHALISHDRGLLPTKPVLDGEPVYEDTPDGIWTGRHDGPRAGADAVRRKAYWAVFAGACGHTYGHNDIYGFNTPAADGKPVFPPNGSGNLADWRTVLDAPGALQMKHVRRLMETRGFASLEPDPSVISGDPGKGSDRALALRGSSRALVYVPTGRAVRVRMPALACHEALVTWFDPRTGRTRRGGRVGASTERQFDPPGEPGPGSDWVLILDGVRPVGTR